MLVWISITVTASRACLPAYRQTQQTEIRMENWVRIEVNGA